MKRQVLSAAAAALIGLTAVVSAQIADELIPNLPMAPAAPEGPDLSEQETIPAEMVPPGRMLPDERALVRNTNAAALGAGTSTPTAVQEIPPRQSTQVDAGAVRSSSSPPSNVPPPTQEELDNAKKAPVVDSVRILEQRLPTITPQDLAPLNPVIQQAPGWLKTQERLDVQHYVHLRALEREAALAKLRADIATEEKRTRAALSDDDDSRGRSSVGGGLRSRDIDPENFDQLSQLASLLPAARGGQAQVQAPPPPPPAPPKLLLVSGDTARIDIGGTVYSASPGETVGGRFKVESVDFSSVRLREGDSVMTLSVNW